MSEGKQVLVRNWLLKASHDLTAARLLSQREPAVRHVAIYHCQQAGEKALKGFLVFWDQRVDKTHDLKTLLKKALAIEPHLAASRDAAARLTPYAMADRYPNPIGGPSLEEVEEALNDATGIYKQVLSYLPTEAHPETTDSDAG